MSKTECLRNFHVQFFEGPKMATTTSAHSCVSNLFATLHIWSSNICPVSHPNIFLLWTSTMNPVPLNEAINTPMSTTLTLILLNNKILSSYFRINPVDQVLFCHATPTYPHTSKKDSQIYAPQTSWRKNGKISFFCEIAL